MQDIDDLLAVVNYYTTNQLHGLRGINLSFFVTEGCNFNLEQLPPPSLQSSPPSTS